MNRLILDVGIKSDPIEYRYSFTWLFKLMRAESIRFLQLGSFFELYHLPDIFFLNLKREADEFDVTILSVFTSHRELGGFLHKETYFHKIARQNYERLIEVAALVGAESVGTNPGSLPRDELEIKENRIDFFIDQMKELMHYGALCFWGYPQAVRPGMCVLPARSRNCSRCTRSHSQVIQVNHYPAWRIYRYGSRVSVRLSFRSTISSSTMRCVPKLKKSFLERTENSPVHTARATLRSM